MTRLTKSSGIDKRKAYIIGKSIEEIWVEGNRTHINIGVEFYDENGEEQTCIEVITLEIPTLEVIQTFNATFINHAIGKLKVWLNQIVK